MAAADQDCGQRDDETGPQAITLEDEFPPVRILLSAR
jgi:hypothetical protein